MDPVEEFAALRETLRWMKAREAVLRDHFLSAGARRASNSHVVTVRTQHSRRLRRDRLPEAILNDPRYWEETLAHVVTVRSLASQDRRLPRREEDIVLIE